MVKQTLAGEAWRRTGTAVTILTLSSNVFQLGLWEVGWSCEASWSTACASASFARTAFLQVPLAMLFRGMSHRSPLKLENSGRGSCKESYDPTRTMNYGHCVNSFSPSFPYEFSFLLVNNQFIQVALDLVRALNRHRSLSCE